MFVLFTLFFCSYQVKKFTPFLMLSALDSLLRVLSLLGLRELTCLESKEKDMLST